MNDHAIEIRGLTKVFPRFQLGPLDLTVPRGAIYGLIGPNAAGKTTTLDLILGLGEPNAGRIRVLGLDHREDEVAVKGRVGYVSPDLTYAAWGNVRSAVRFIQGFYPAWDHDYCIRLFETFRLDPDERIAALSFGTRVKLSLVMALAWRPDVLILDEPTVGLDAVSKQQIFAELLGAVRDGERTVLISSHQLSDLERFTDHVGIMDLGKLLIEGATDAVVNRFRMVDFDGPDGAALERIEGIRVQARKGTRVQALVDVLSGAIQTAAARGARTISEAPVTLEELFVGLMKGE